MFIPEQSFDFKLYLQEVYKLLMALIFYLYPSGQTQVYPLRASMH